MHGPRQVRVAVALRCFLGGCFYYWRRGDTQVIPGRYRTVAKWSAHPPHTSSHPPPGLPHRSLSCTTLPPSHCAFIISGLSFQVVCGGPGCMRCCILRYAPDSVVLCRRNPKPQRQGKAHPHVFPPGFCPLSAIYFPDCFCSLHELAACKRAEPWRADPGQNNSRLCSQVAVVTGGNTGLGYVTVLELARKGAHVIMACRSESKARAAIADILSQLPDSRPVIDFIPLDLQSLASVRAFTTEFRRRGLPLHMLGTHANRII
jgi:hypothetical protein